jgi:hypothetical protein
LRDVLFTVITRFSIDTLVEPITLMRTVDPYGTVIRTAVAVDSLVASTLNTVKPDLPHVKTISPVLYVVMPVTA